MGTTTPQQEQALEKGKQLLKDLVAGQYEAIHGTFDKAMSEMMPVEGVSATWAQIQLQAGKFQELVSSKVVTQEGHDIVLLTLKFERGSLLNRLVYSPEGKLAGLHFAPKD